jgi:signal transduction histidine kinase/ActR/RegA family two-component response regulator
MNLHPRHLSLRARLVGLVTLLVAAFACFFLVFFPSRMEAQARSSMGRRGLDMARLLASATEPALDFGDAVYAQRLLATLASSPEVLHGALLREDGSALAMWRPSQVPSIPLAGPEETWIHGQQLIARVPLQTRGGQRGTLVVGFSLAGLEAERRRTLELTAIISALILGLGGLAAFGLGTLLVGPLKRVTRVALRISEGDSAAQAELDLSRRDETGMLASALSRMLRRLYEQKALVEERTRELAERLRELHSTQEQLIVADRRTSVGTLAAGVAHEINNPLAYVTGNVQFALRELPRMRVLALRDCPHEERLKVDAIWTDVLEALTEAGEGCSRVQHIVQSLKSFSRGDDGRREPTDLRRTLEAAINMAANEVRYRARLVRDYQDVPPVEANEVRLAQVFLNLLINAAQAIEPGAAEQNEIRVSLRRAEDGRVRIDISDTGCGMPPEVRNRLFTPFFTTKPVGVGTGLGLSVCQGIVNSLGGQIEVQSEQGRGSTFTVRLPAAAEVQPVSAPVRVQPPAAVRRARVLVVDDEPYVVASLQRILSREHEVTVTTQAREALARVLQGPGFDVILCDLMMPEMTGMEFFTELQRRAPSQAERVTFFTGGAFTDATRAFIEQHQERVLSKPILPDQLREYLRTQLARRAPVTDAPELTVSI